MEAKIIMARFLRSFDYESVSVESPDEFDEDLTLHLRYGLTVRLKLEAWSIVWSLIHHDATMGFEGISVNVMGRIKLYEIWTMALSIGIVKKTLKRAHTPPQ